MTHHTDALTDARDSLRILLSHAGHSSVPAWTLLYACRAHLSGKDCPGYRGTDGTAQLLADCDAFLGATT